MGRGLELACEQCDFSERLLERIPFARDDDGNAHTLDATHPTPAGYWSDWLCGQCLLPARLEATAADGHAGACPRCGAELLSFDTALRQLAEASHSRAVLDLRIEQEAHQRLSTMLSEAPRLRTELESGVYTTQEALEQLASQLTVLAPSVAEGVAPTSDPSRSFSLDNLGTLMENAFDLDDATRILRDRLRHSDLYMADLKLFVENESSLPGVPCPRCGTGQLVHWPFWI
ncbi:MAG: hypothetical protein ACXWQZ_16860 [Ktedonobacterales bacterium]